MKNNDFKCQDNWDNCISIILKKNHSFTFTFPIYYKWIHYHWGIPAPTKTQLHFDYTSLLWGLSE